MLVKVDSDAGTRANFSWLAEGFLQYEKELVTRNNTTSEFT
jgi:hypothetical protein